MQYSAKCKECSWNVSTNELEMYDHMVAQHIMRYDHDIEMDG